MDMNKIRETVKQKTQQAKVKVRYCVNRTEVWARNNPQLAVAAVTTIVSAGAYIGKNAIKHANLRKAEKVKQEYCYDPSLGHYWELKRKLSNQEWVRIEQRKAAGEKLGDILSSLNVLK